MLIRQREFVGGSAARHGRLNLVEMLSATSTPIPLAVFRACAAIPDPVIGFLFSRTEQQAAEVGRSRSPRLLKRPPRIAGGLTKAAKPGDVQTTELKLVTTL